MSPALGTKSGWVHQGREKLSILEASLSGEYKGNYSSCTLYLEVQDFHSW